MPEARIKEQEEKKKSLENRLNREKNRTKYLSVRKYKARTHRLITRGAAIESLVPEVKDVSEKSFYECLDIFLSRGNNRGEFISILSRFRDGG